MRVVSQATGNLLDSAFEEATRGRNYLKVELVQNVICACCPCARSTLCNLMKPLSEGGGYATRNVLIGKCVYHRPRIESKIGLKLVAMVTTVVEPIMAIHYQFY